MEGQGIYSRARKRAQAKYGFYVHLAVYIAVMVLLVVINLVTNSGNYWFIWPLFGWGIAIVIHALSTFVFSGESAIIERMTQREIEKEKSRRQ